MHIALTTSMLWLALIKLLHCARGMFGRTGTFDYTELTLCNSLPARYSTTIVLL